MSEQKNQNLEEQETAAQEQAASAEAADQAQEAVQPQEEQAESPNPLLEELETLKKNLSDQEDKYLRLAAEYDNYRRRSQKEKESAWADSKAETAAAFLPVYDNLERALKQETADEAFKKGVEMTMTQLKEILAKLGIEEIPALGETFDPNFHNAVMHVEDESAGENTIVDVFQAGFKSGDKVIRFAMVKVAN